MIIWGRKRVTKELGRVADFCGVCRKISSFKFICIASVGHIYYIPLGEGEIIGNLVNCEICGSNFVTDAMNYKHISTDKEALLNQLIYNTNPDVEKKYEDRLLLEEKVRLGGVSLQDRINLIREALILGASASIPGPETNTNPGVIAGFSLLLAGILSVLILPAVISKLPSVVIFTCVGVAVFGFLLAMISANRSAKHLKSDRLIMVLKPLKPSFSELEESVKFLKSAGHSYMGCLSPAKILQTIESN